jgi:hypothetical protein
MELSRPTVKGSTAWGNKTVSRTGKTATRRKPGVSFSEEGLEEGGMGDWFDIECPRISFSSLEHADFIKFQELLFSGDISSFRNPLHPLYGQT